MWLKTIDPDTICSIKFFKNWEASKAETILSSVIWVSISYEIFCILVCMPHTKLDQVEKALSYKFFNQFSAKLWTKESLAILNEVYFEV